MAELEYVDLRHDCETPSVDHLPRFGRRYQVMARWRCPECGTRWHYAASFLHYDRMYWEAVSKPRRRWVRAETKRLTTPHPRPSKDRSEGGGERGE